ncbi:unnamed protein product [Mesocestoides corti]|uniref:EF-hand domain-containing protein n=1 Tax=Mesocestoides corti TaxID=53468 RepID=A0A0R3UKI2_MESCO|nr:unnamed protein product [Mesocestoides corti]
MLFNLSTVKKAFDNAADGKHYLTSDDSEICLIELFGQRPSQRLMNHLSDNFDVSVNGNPVGISLPKLISFVKNDLCCPLDKKEGPTRQELLALFQALDSRGYNFVTMKDFLSRANSRLLRGSLRMAFKVFDIDGDGRVSYRDFVEGIVSGEMVNL